MALPDLSLPAAPLRLLDQVRERVRHLRYSLRTEQADVHWVRAFVRFHGLRHPCAGGGGRRGARPAGCAGGGLNAPVRCRLATQPCDKSRPG